MRQHRKQARYHVAWTEDGSTQVRWFHRLHEMIAFWKTMRRRSFHDPDVQDVMRSH